MSASEELREQVARALCIKWTEEDGYSTDSDTFRSSLEKGMWRNFLGLADVIVSLPAIRSALEAAETYRKALELIAAQKNMTLIAPSCGQEFDYAHQLGATKAFNQLADIAQEALSRAAREETPGG